MYAQLFSDDESPPSLEADPFVEESPGASAASWSLGVLEPSASSGSAGRQGQAGISQPAKTEEVQANMDENTSGGTEATEGTGGTGTGAEESAESARLSEESVEQVLRIRAMYAHTNIRGPVVPRSRILANAVGAAPAVGDSDADCAGLFEDVDPEHRSEHVSIEGRELHDMNYEEAFPRGRVGGSMTKTRRKICGHADDIEIWVAQPLHPG